MSFDNTIESKFKLDEIEYYYKINLIGQEDRADKLYGNGKYATSIDKAKEAAALCQYVYATNPNLPRKTKYDIGDWIPYDDNRDKLDRLKNGIFNFLGNGAILYTNESDNFIDKIGNTEELPFLSLKERIGYYGLLGGILGRRTCTSKDVLISLKGRLERNRIGFRSMVFYKTNAGEIKKIAYVTEGSLALNLVTKHPIDGFGDWGLSNLGQGVLGISPQHTLSIQNAKILDKLCKSKGIDLEFYGHSLGGGLAASNALATNRKAIVFDMAGLNWSRRNRYNYRNQYFNIKNFYVEGEILSVKGVWDFLKLEHNGYSFKIEVLKHDGSKIKAADAHNLELICKALGCQPI